jgi:hypothetical protein
MDHAEGLLQAANDLGDAMGSAAEKSSSFNLSEGDVKAVSALTDLAGRWHLERKRKKVLRDLAHSYANTVHQVAPVLEGDFQLQWNSPCRPVFQDGRARSAPASGESKPAGMLDVYCQTAYNLKRNARRLVDSPSTDYDRRSGAVDGYVLAHNAQINGWLISQKGTALLRQLNKSAAELEKVLNNKKYKSEDIKQLGKDVKTLTSSLKLLTEAE